MLILGGTGDARRLASLAATAGFEVISSLAGRTTNPELPEGEVRLGGFGRADGLATYLRAEGVELLVDATHPFADGISANAAEAAVATGVPRLLLERPRWEETPGDRWIRVESAAAAAMALPTLAQRVFLTIGRQELAAFAHLEHLWFLSRMIEVPAVETRRPPGELLLDRGPFSDDGERALMRAHRIEVLVTRNSGGEETYPKIAAARALRLPVVMIDRPQLPASDIVDGPAAALTWLLARGAGRFH